MNNNITMSPLHDYGGMNPTSGEQGPSITLNRVKDALRANAHMNKRPDYTLYAAKLVHYSILSGISHPLKDFVLRWVESMEAQDVQKKNVPDKNGKSSRLAMNRIAAAETLAIGENTFIGQCHRHGYSRFYVYKHSGHACAECKKEFRSK